MSSDSRLTAYRYRDLR